MKTKKLYRRVEAAFSLESLRAVCEAPIKWFEAYGHRVNLNESYHSTPKKLKAQGWPEDAIEFFTKSPRKQKDDERYYFFKDNGSNVLAVAHLDTVQKKGWCEAVRLPHDTFIFSPKLDDRLGAYVILELLPKLGVNCDILLTTDEEQGASTASEFETTKQYNWIVEFDRMGSDVVLYQYEAHKITDALEDQGFKIGQGSYSDIRDLVHLNCKAFNVGVGYENYHSEDCYARLRVLLLNVTRFVKFYLKHKDTRFEHEPFDRGFPKSEGKQGSLFEHAYGFEGGIHDGDPFGTMGCYDADDINFEPLGNGEECERCDVCGTLFSTADLMRHHGKTYCYDCIDTKIAVDGGV